ncbi:transcriptional repressor [Amylibacter sp.]|nr:transcriptional repressor [Amylibacter sp.]MDB4248493.1 transcriptional repressor [Amylibacter sp.]
MNKKTSTLVGFKQHNHVACLENAINTAEEYCSKNNLNLTPIRKKVLELLLQEHRALGAYAILAMLREQGFSNQPPLAYRALDFLVEHGFAHKIEKLNAFVACSLPGANHSPAFLICKKCNTVAETQTSLHNISFNETANSTGFQIEQTIMEAQGICKSCTETNQI